MKKVDEVRVTAYRNEVYQTNIDSVMDSLAKQQSTNGCWKGQALKELYSSP